MIKNGQSLNIQKLLIKVPFTIIGILNEINLQHHNFTDPGTNLNLSLVENDNPKDWSKRIDRDDALAYIHDL